MELKIPKSVEPNILSVNDDLWPSDSDDDNDKRSPRHVTSTIKNRKSAKKFEFVLLFFIFAFVFMILCFFLLCFAFLLFYFFALTSLL